MEATPLISIITITFQAENVLVRTLESVLALNYPNIEYLLVDGNSNDKTLSIIKDYEAKFSNRGFTYRWVSEPDRGIYDAMNKGLKLATGNYVWFMNAGDCIASNNCIKDIFEKLSQTADDKPDFLYGETKIVDNAGNILGDRRLKAPKELHWKSFRSGMLVCHQSMLVKRLIAPEFNLTYHYSADFDWSIRCLKNASSIYNTHTVLSHFLDGGVSKKKMKASLQERFSIMAENYGWMQTALRHLWFVCRAAWFKLHHGWI